MASLGEIEVLLIAVICFLMFIFILFGELNGILWNWPVMGMLPGVILDINRISEKCVEIVQQTTGGTFLFKGPWFAKMDMLLTVDPLNVHYIMTSNFVNYHKGPDYKKMLDILGDAFLTSDCENSQNQVKVIKALINHNEFQQFLVKATKEKVENGLIPILDHAAKQGTSVDLQDLFQRFTMCSTCIFVTGYDPGYLSLSLPDAPLLNAINNAEEALLMRHVLPESVLRLQRWLGLGHEKILAKAWKTANDTIERYISIKREDLGKGLKMEDLLTSYMNLDYEGTGLELCDKFLRDTVFNLMIAGTSTISSTLTSFFWLVAKNPSVEAEIRKEMGAILGQNESQKGKIFSGELETRGLVYLHAALCESLRLYPPMPFHRKQPIQEDILPSGHRVHPKLKIIISLYAMGRTKSIWGDDCLEFKPQRWISDSGKIRIQPTYKFMAFNAPPRSCIGKDMAFTQMKAVAATIIHNYNVHVVEGHIVAPNNSVIQYMKYGLKVRVEKRWF